MIKYKIKLYLMCTILILLLTTTFSWFVKSGYFSGSDFLYEKTFSTPSSLSFVNYVGTQDEFGSVEYTQLSDDFDINDFNALEPGSSIVFKTEVLNPFEREVQFSITLGNVSMSDELVDYLTIYCTSPTENVISASEHAVGDDDSDTSLISRVTLVEEAYVPAAVASDDEEELINGVFEVYWFVNISTTAGNDIMEKTFNIEYIQVQG